MIICSRASAQEIERHTFPKKETGLNPLKTEKSFKTDKTKSVNVSGPKDTVAAPSQQIATYTRPDAEKRFKRYVNSVVGPYALTGIVARAGFGTALNEPEEGGKKWEGFGRRVASNFGKNVIQETAIYGLDEALKIDSRFYRSQKRDVGSRVRNALLSTVTARRPNGKRVFGVSRVAGTYAAGIIANETWYPSRYDYKDGLRDGTISLGFVAAFNLFREFIWKK